MNFNILRLRGGQSYKLESNLETAVLLMTGSLKFNYDGITYVAERCSYFDESPIVLHIPQEFFASMDAINDCELLVMQVENERRFKPCIFDNSNLIENDLRGKDILDNSAYRLVRTVFDKRNRPESNMVVGEIITFSGHWSSYPPHSHLHPEIYHYRFSEPQGFAFSEDGENALKVNHNDTLVITNEKTHAHATAPGYALYTLWFIRHLNNNPYIMPNFDETHEWTRKKEANYRVYQPC